MNKVGGNMDVAPVIPSLRELACQANYLEKALSGEHSWVCLYFINRCVHQADDMYEGLSDKVGEEDVHGRLGRVVKVARWAAHNMLLWCGAILSAPFTDWRLIGTHANVIGDEFWRLWCGTYVVLESLSWCHTAS